MIKIIEKSRTIDFPRLCFVVNVLNLSYKIFIMYNNAGIRIKSQYAITDSPNSKNAIDAREIKNTSNILLFF